MKAKPLNEQQIMFLIRASIGGIRWFNGGMRDSNHKWSMNTLDAMIRRKLVRVPRIEDGDNLLVMTDEGKRLVDGLVSSWPHLAARVGASA